MIRVRNRCGGKEAAAEERKKRREFRFRMADKRSAGTYLENRIQKRSYPSVERRKIETKTSEASYARA